MNKVQPQNNNSAMINLNGRLITAQEANVLAIKEHSLGNFQAAVDIYGIILAQLPNNADAYSNQSIILHQMGRYEEALVSCNKAIALNPNNAGYYYTRANTLSALQRPTESLADYDKVVALSPGFAEGYNNRGTTLQTLKRFSEALENYERAIALKTDYADAHNNRGSVLHDMKRYEEAVASCDKAIAFRPNYAQSHYNRAVNLQALKRFPESLASYDKVIALTPGFAEAHNNRGNVLQSLKRYDEAVASYDMAIANRPTYAEAYNNRGITLRELKRYDEALASCSKAIELKPGHASSYQNQGITLVDIGRMEDAEKMFRKALELKPDFTNPWFSLTNIHQYSDANHADVKAIQATLDKFGAALPEPDYLYFALGKIYDDCGLYDQAFEAYRQANDILGKEVTYNAANVSANTDRLIEVFNKDFLSQQFAFSSNSQSPIFIVGMPRSGTTLMASMLSNHYLVATAGELTTIARFILQRPELNPYPQAARNITSAFAVSMIHDYEKRLRRDADPDVSYVIDKYPLNLWHLGLISMLFPKAHVIHCTRDPLDIVISTYFRRFGLDHDYSFDLRNIGHFYGEYVKIMEHWRKVLPMKMIEVSYEDMIMNTEAVARRILDFLGLDWDEHCLAPHTNPSPVETASNWQVRQPIYTQAVERWRHYEKQLAPVKEMLKLQ